MLLASIRERVSFLVLVRKGSQVHVVGSIVSGYVRGSSTSATFVMELWEYFVQHYFMTI